MGIISFPKKFYDEFNVNLINNQSIIHKNKTVVNEDNGFSVIIRYWLNMIPTNIGYNINIVMKVIYNNEEITNIVSYSYDFLKSIDYLLEEHNKQIYFLEKRFREKIKYFTLHTYIKENIKNNLQKGL